jgi:ferredoxin
MAFVITDNCIKDALCVDACPVDCIHPRMDEASFDAQQLTEIDHAAQTWSVTPFAEISTSRSDLDTRMGKTDARRAAKPTAISADGYVISEGHRRLELGFDRRVVLSRAAAEVLIGAAYPGVKSAESDDILSVAAIGGSVSAMTVGSPGDGAYGLLTERTLTIEANGTTLVSHNSVIRIGDETPPADAMLIEPGSKRIESRLTRMSRELRDLDTLPSANAQH